MQSGGGSGRNPASSSSSPTSSFNGASAPINFRQLGLLQQQQQQQQLLQQLQQQQLRKVEGEDARVAFQHGVAGGSNFPAMPQPPRNLYQGVPQLLEENQKRVQVTGQQLHSLSHQSYPQFAFQAAQQQSLANLLLQQQGKIGPSGKDQEMLANSQKMRHLMSLQAANQPQIPAFKMSTEQGQTSNDKGSELKPPPSANVIRPMQSSQTIMQNAATSQLGLSQLKAIQAWAQQNNIDLSIPANVNLMNQLLPLWQSTRMAALQKQNETNTPAHQSHMPLTKPPVMTSSAGSENSAEGNSLSDQSGQAGLVKGHLNLHAGPVLTGAVASGASSNAVQMPRQSSVCGSENQNENVGKSPMVIGNGGPMMQKPETSGDMGKSGEQSHANNAFCGTESLQSQHLRPLQQVIRPSSHPALASSEGVSVKVPPQSGSMQMTQQHIGFTKQQQHVLKAQILAFRRIKRGDHTLPQEVLAAIVPPPLDLHFQQSAVPSGIAKQERAAANHADGRTGHVEIREKPPQLIPSTKGHNLAKEEPVSGEEKVVHHAQGASLADEHSRLASVGNAEHSTAVKTKVVERSNQNISSKGDTDGDKGKSVPVNIATSEAGQLKKAAPSSNKTNTKEVSTRRYHGPLFDFPYFSRRSDSVGSIAANCSSNLTLGYDVKDLLFEEGINVLNKKRTENLKKINGLLAVNLERKRIRPDLMLQLQIKEKKLRLLDFQARLREEVDQQQQEIMAMSDRPYRKFVRDCERQRVELSRQVQQLQKLSRDKKLKSIFQWRKKLLEAHWAIRDARTTRNRGVAKYHEKMLREFSKRKDDDRNKRMEALKNNDVDRYREMLLEQQTSVPGDAAQRYDVLSSFLSQTEEYLLKLGGKITASKANQEVEEAASSAARAARSQGLSEEEVKAAAACAREEVMIRNRFSEMNAPKGSSSVNKYYNLAHAVNERVLRQPSMLRTGTLRDYQLVGLQWMLSLYNNKLNGILADEMGLGKTVQVMALIAYLMEFKGNYGPHLIIVPNAVLVNWKSELLNWLPSAKCIFYVGQKELRSKLFSHEVVSMKFNILVTTYEFVMYDRSKLSRINWKYIIIDEAQRMKDRESVLARDLDRYSCQRRLLLTGTPLQNELKELWSLLNLLLPEVFDNRKAFHDWFSQPFQKDGPSRSPEEDDWLETEKKVIIIHRLHQILEPFMLRRRVEDVEGSLPPKIPIVLRCRMSAIQGAIYDWIKSTGTVRVDPEDEMRKAEKNPMYQVKMYKNLNNKCMELRKVCNHPLLNYPFFKDYSKDFLVRSCGKLWVLDRILIKLQRAGHRVLLFSTMTKLLDIIEEYLQWRRLVYRRIDGTTSLEDREAAIVNFNSPDSDSFIFLLSIRAAGRGLNLQSADTVVIYDPDPNPQNEEQAVARAHRIGQTREVKVIYMEAVVDKISSFQKEDELRNGGSGVDLEDDLVGKDRYMGSIESLIRNNIQQYKIDMADEVINAGRFDQRTTHEERRMTLESLLHDEERGQETVHDVPSLQEVNRMIARSEEELELFDQMDEEFDWTRDMVKYNQVPRWLRAGSREVDAIVSSLSKKPSKNILTTNINLDSTDATGLSFNRAEKRRGRPKGSLATAKRSIYVESDDEDDEDSDSSSDEGTVNLSQEEEGEGGENEDEEFDDSADVPSNNKVHSEEDALVYDAGNYDTFIGVAEGMKSIHMFEETLSTGFNGSQRLPEHYTLSMSSQKFGSLSALDVRPGHLSERMSDELEEGEIAASGDSRMDLQQSGSWIHDRDDGEEQVLQPKLKRKRSIRIRPKHTVERFEEKASQERNFHQHASIKQSGTGQETGASNEPISQRNDIASTSVKQKRNIPLRKNSLVFPKSGRLNKSGSADEVADPSSWSSTKPMNGDGLSSVNTKMSESMQRKCRNVVSKFKRKVDKVGHQIIPILFDLWKRNENSSFSSNLAGSSNLLDLNRIEQRVDSLEYNGVMDLVADVQSMLEAVVRYSSYSPEVGKEARELQDLFFDIMKMAFPDTDFRRARNAVTFSDPVGGPASSNQGKGKAKTIGKEYKPLASNLREQSPQPEHGPPLLLAHPGDLVICKKRRKDRDKQRVVPASPLSNNMSARAGPLSPPSAGWAVGTSSSMQEVQWAKPVKRTRTDAGKRRPSHL